MMTRDQDTASLNRARRMSLGDQLARQARKNPRKVALRCRSVSRTFAQVDDRVTRLANGLATRGATAGDRVAVLMTNSAEAVEAYLAICRLGCVVVPINFRLAYEEIAYITGDSGARILVVDAGLFDIASQAQGLLRNDLLYIVVGSDGQALEHAEKSGRRCEQFENLIAGSSQSAVEEDVPESSPAFIMYTSGTTGRPKGAVLSHFNLLINTFNMIQSMGIDGDDEVWLSGLPLFHIGGLNGILPYLMVGGTNVILPSGDFDAKAVLRLFEQEAITGCCFVPTQWQEICAVPGASEGKYRLRRINWGASKSPLSVLRAMQSTFRGVPIYTAFGQTEMSSITCVLGGDDADRKMGSVGKPISNVEMRIVDDDMNDVAPGDVGEAVYRGATVMQGYWNMPAETTLAFEGGWFHSGDLCRVDSDGFVYVIDRKKDMIISGGENIYPAEVERVIEDHPKVKEVAVVGVAHPKWIETPRAIVVPKDWSDSPTEEEIIEFCKERLASYKKPTSVVLAGQLPRNASGKVLKRVLRQQQEAASSADVAGAGMVTP